MKRAKHIEAWLAKLEADPTMVEVVARAINPGATHPLDRHWATEEAVAVLRALRELAAP